LTSNLAYSDIKRKQNDLTCKYRSSLPALEGLTAFVLLLQQEPINSNHPNTKRFGLYLSNPTKTSMQTKNSKMQKQKQKQTPKTEERKHKRPFG